MPKTVVGRMTSVLFVGILSGANSWELAMGRAASKSLKEREWLKFLRAMGSRIAQTVEFL